MTASNSLSICINMNVSTFHALLYMYMSVIHFSCPVNLADFKQHIVYMRADSDFKYAEQFEVSSSVFLQLLHSEALEWLLCMPALV